MIKVKEIIIFLFLFLAVFGTFLFIFNGRFIYAQIKYVLIGSQPEKNENSDMFFTGPDANIIPQRLVIPSLGVDAPIILPENSDENTLQMALEKGVAFWPGSSPLGVKGTIVILGHSSAYPWYKGNYGSVFSLLNNLKEGDDVFIFSSQGKYEYKVTGKEINFPDDLNIENQDSEQMLYLLSCWPIKTNWKRIAIKAISIDPDTYFK